MKVHIICLNTWYLPTVPGQYSDIDSEILKYDHSLWIPVSFFLLTHGFSFTIHAAYQYDAYFQLLRCCCMIKGTNIPSGTHQYKIGWSSRLSRAPRERIGHDFVARFVRTSNFAVEFSRTDNNVIVAIFHLWFTINNQRHTFK